MRFCYVFLLFPAFLLILSQVALGQELTPFSSVNQNPFVSIYGLPSAGSAQVLEQGQNEIEWRMDVSSSCSLASNTSESIILDGESYRTVLAFRRGLGHKLEFGMELPYVMHRQGFLDNFIINWHDFFGLPQGERENVPEDQLAYRYATTDGTQIELVEETEGLGDLRLTGAWQLWHKKTDINRSLALRGSLKLPTGDDSKLTGSGSTDLAVWLSGSQSNRPESVTGFGALGLLLMTEGAVLSDKQNNAVVFGTLGIGWHPYRYVSFKTQLDTHSAFYRNSDFRELGESVQLVMGGTLHFSEQTTLDLGVSEDLVVDSAPDVNFHLALKTHF